MTWKNTITAIFVFLLMTTVNYASESHTDNQLIERYPGTEIKSRYKDDLIQYSVALGPIKDEKAQSKSLEGSIDHIMYKGSEEDSILRVYKVLKRSLEENSFDIIYSCQNEDCGGSMVEALIDTGKQSKYRSVNYAGPVHTSFYYLASKQEINGTDHYLIYFIYKYSRNAVYIAQDILTVATSNIKTLDVKLDFTTIEKTGKVTLDGINFETNSSQINPSSEDSLKKIATYLKKNHGKKFYVVGHTDSDGSFTSNMSLSKARAESVVNILVDKFEIKPNSLSAHGMGPLSPNSSNIAAAGKQNNRRVELVEK